MLLSGCRWHSSSYAQPHCSFPPESIQGIIQADWLDPSRHNKPHPTPPPPPPRQLSTRRMYSVGASAGSPGEKYVKQFSTESCREGKKMALDPSLSQREGSFLKAKLKVCLLLFHYTHTQGSHLSYLLCEHLSKEVTFNNSAIRLSSVQIAPYHWLWIQKKRGEKKEKKRKELQGQSCSR